MGSNHGNSANLVKHQRCNGGTKHDEVRRWSKEERLGGAAGGETKTNLINYRVLWHRQTPSRYRRPALPLVVIISVAVQGKWSIVFGAHFVLLNILRLDSFVFLKSRVNNGELEPFCLAVSLQSGSLMNLLRKIMYFKKLILDIDSIPQRQHFPLTSTLS